MSRIAADGTQLGVAAFQNLIAERGTHVRTAFKKRAWELESKTDRQATCEKSFDNNSDYTVKSLSVKLLIQFNNKL